MGPPFASEGTGVPPPGFCRRVHIVGICGRATSALASELVENGCCVSGSDENAFSPGLDALPPSVKTCPTFRGDQVPRDADCVIVGSCFGRGNPEVEAAFALGLPVMNFAQFIGRNFLSASERCVIAGTNGKTTTTAMLAFVLEACGKAPDFLIGGTAPDLPSSARFRGASHLVIEGDEYPGGHWDANPKFASYAPTTGILTNVFHDHPEIFGGLGDVQNTFRRFVNLIPENGVLIASADDKNSAPVFEGAPCPIDTVGFSQGADYRISKPHPGVDGIAFSVHGVRVRLRMHGKMNARNAAMALHAAVRAGIDARDAAAALPEFRGVTGRQELLHGSERFAHISDIAYHPDAIHHLLSSVRARFPKRRLLLALQPQNTGGRHSDYQRDLPGAFKTADGVFLTKPFDFGSRAKDAFDGDIIARELQPTGVAVECLESPDEVPAAFANRGRRGDVLVSSLGFLSAPVLEELNKIGRGL